MKKIRADRVALALTNLADWKSKVQSQGATHLFPMLALIEQGAGLMEREVLFNETPDEYDYWDKYFRLNDDNEDKPYFNPITLRRAEKGFPHSNSATIRKNTFAGKWRAATRDLTVEGEVWLLEPNYADIFRDKVLSKGGRVTRIPVVDVAALMFRGHEFADDASALDLERKFRETFRQRDEDYEKLFVFKHENEDRIFVDVTSIEDYAGSIKSVLVDDLRSAGAIPASKPSPQAMDLDDPILVQVQKLLGFGTSGIILSGPPGTGKSYYAKRLAHHLVNDPALDVFRVQFHPSYGYEDFVEGYRPDEGSVSGYRVVEKIFLLACARASIVQEDDGLVVVLVDEINRGDPARIFGEILTYIEREYRQEPFVLPFSGKHALIPDNLIIIGTMNPFDRSIAQVDAAFIRRFDHIELEPSREVAEMLLDAGGGFNADQVTLIGEWFDNAQRLIPFGIGHSYFANVSDIDDLLLVWRYRIRPSVELAVELNDGVLTDIVASFDALVRRLEGGAGDE